MPSQVTYPDLSRVLQPCKVQIVIVFGVVALLEPVLRCAEMKCEGNCQEYLVSNTLTTAW